MQEQSKKSKWSIALSCVFASVAILGIGACVAFAALPSQGYQNYVVQKKQHFVEYSEQYEYWDVLTIEYPCLEGIDAPQVAQINEKLFDTAMDRVNYWHLKPNDEVRKLQEEYHIFSSDVRCDVTYHSQYLLSMEFEEIYAPISPVYYVNMTQRGLNIDLMTGETYALEDIIQIDENFIAVWCEAAYKKYGNSFPNSDDVCDVMLNWFHKESQKQEALYDFDPFFYITAERDFVIGIALNPKVEGLVGGKPINSTYCVKMTAQELIDFHTDSEFWDKYVQSETAGKVKECAELEENLWLGDEASVWGYWKKYL